MIKLICAIAIVVGWGAVPTFAAPPALTTLRDIRTLTNAQAIQHQPVSFEATVIYYRPYDGTMFVQDGDVATYVQPTKAANVVRGDRVVVQGTMHESFRPFIFGAEVTLLHHGPVLEPIPANFDQLIHARLDGMLVKVNAVVIAADTTVSFGVRSTNLQMLTDGGSIDAQVDSDDPAALSSLLDARVEVTGAASGRFDGKMQMTGIALHVTSLADIKVVGAAGTSPWTLPITPMDGIIAGYRVVNTTPRIRVQGTITFYQPGSAVVLQNGTKSLWVDTESRVELQVGDVADATGLPGIHDGFLRLTRSEVKDSHVRAPVSPLPVTWEELSESHHVYDLVSIEGKVVAEVREAAQDSYVVDSDGHLFSAIIRHPAQTTVPSMAPPAMKQIPLGATVRVAGICTLEDSNPFNTQVPFDLLMRSVDDITIVARPSWLSVRNLTRLAGVLLLMVLAVSAWGWTLNRKVRRQTAALARQREAEAELERRTAQLEQRRSHILEAINGSMPLAEVLEDITQLISFCLHGAACWCEVVDGARLGQRPAELENLRIVRENIPSREGPSLGTLFAAADSQAAPTATEKEAFYVGSRLATLAIETRRLYSDLVHRSEFDLLTDIHNRFSLDNHLDALITQAREKAGVFGLIYIDLDHFKQINDQYGHGVGDLYLKEVSLRMKDQLRTGDLLARLGGDEFAVLVPVVRNRSDVDEIAVRLEQCFEDPYAVEGYELNGSASLGIALYPEDGTTKDSLLKAADAAMYVAKNTARLQSKQPMSRPTEV